MLALGFWSLAAICGAVFFFMHRAHAGRLLNMPLATPDDIQQFWNALTNRTTRTWSGLLTAIPLVYFFATLSFWPGRSMYYSTEIFAVWIVIMQLTAIEAYWDVDRKLGKTWSRLAVLRFHFGFRVFYSFPLLGAATAIEIYRQYELRFGGPWRELSLIQNPVRAYDMVMMTVVCYVVLLYAYAYAAYLLLGLKAVKNGEPADTVAKLCDKAGIRNPRVWVLPDRGGNLALAYCTGKRDFIFSRYLLDHMELDELTAIAAHECGHPVARHGVKKTRLLYFLFLIALLAIAICPAGIETPFNNLMFRFMVPLGAMMLGWGFFRRTWTRQELDADRIGAELIGDPRLMARTLVRLHELAFLPAEFPKTMKNQILHPSLKARVEALDKLAEAAGGAAPPITEAE